MKTSEIAGATVNVAILSVFYTGLGALISYGLFYFVYPFSEEWKKGTLGFQLLDIVAELSLVGILAFWITYNIKEAPPIFKVSKEMDSLVDTYISGIFFAYAMFLFLEFLDDKIKFLYQKYLTPRKMEVNKV
jgi:hypothetical protein